MKLNSSKSQAAVLGILLIFTSVAGYAQGSSSWEVVGPGGGGTTISPTISPHDPRVVVEHCDMTGGYITHNNGLSWHKINLRSVINTFAFDPADSKVIYAGNSAVIYAGNAALWRSNDSGRTFKMLFPNPASNTVEHQLGDQGDYILTSSDPAYPGGDITAIVIAPGSDAKSSHRSPEHLYLAFHKRGNTAMGGGGGGPVHANGTVIVSSADGGNTWSRLATLPQRVLLLTAQGSGLIAIAGSAAWRIAPDGSVTELGSIASPVRAASAGRSGGTAWIYATGRDGNVYLSQDSGLHFTPVTPSLGQSAGKFEAIAASDLHPDVAYVGFRGLQLGEGMENLYNGIAKTTDGGKTWKIVFKESNHAASNLTGSWIEERARQGSHDIWFATPYSLGVAPTNPNVVYASDLFRTYRTLDGGVTWLEVDSKRVRDDSWTSRGLNVTTNYGIQFDPFNSRHIYMDNTDMGLFQS